MSSSQERYERQLAEALLMATDALNILAANASSDGDNERASQLREALSCVKAAAEKMGTDMTVLSIRSLVDCTADMWKYQAYRRSVVSTLTYVADMQSGPQEVRDYAAKRLEKLVNS